MELFSKQINPRQLDQNQVITLVVFSITYFAVIFRNVIKLRTPIWLILFIGALAMIFSGAITPEQAYFSIDLKVLSFLFGMFTLVSALDIAGLLETFSYRILSKATNFKLILASVFFGFGFLSAFLMNDTIALMGTPIMLSVARKTRINPKVLLISLAFAITIGSMSTPMGNPQNLLVALQSGISSPVITFAKLLALPAIVNLVLTWIIITKVNSKVHLQNSISQVEEPKIKDRRLALVSLYCTISTMLLIFIVDFVDSIGFKLPFGISEISLLGAGLVLIFSNKSREIIGSIDWGILVMFASLFILMQSLSKNGIISQLSALFSVSPSSDQNLLVLNVIIFNVLLSQIISNVPTVALYIPILAGSGVGSSHSLAWIALAGGSTLAGNLTVLGAASNLIIIERAEKEGISVSFFEFLRYGIPVTLLNVFILYLFLVLGL